MAAGKMRSEAHLIENIKKMAEMRSNAKRTQFWVVERENRV
jgi:hypothetical protein